MSQMDANSLMAQIKPLQSILNGLVDTLQNDMEKNIKNMTPDQQIEFGKAMQDSGVEKKANDAVQQLKDLNKEPNL